MVLEMFCPFGWTASPGFYDVFARAIKFIQARTPDPSDQENILGWLFAYCWVNDHILVEPDVGNICAIADWALRSAIFRVFSPRATNEKKFTELALSGRVLGVIFDCEEMVVMMPPEKVEKAALVVESCLVKTYNSR